MSVMPCRLILLCVALLSVAGTQQKLKEIDAVVPEELVSHPIALFNSSRVCVCAE